MRATGERNCNAQPSSPLPKQVGTDPRPVMRAAYECFRSGSDPAAIVAAAGTDRSGHGAFYAQL